MAKKTLSKHPKPAKRRAAQDPATTPVEPFSALVPLRSLPGFRDAYDRCRGAYEMIGADDRLVALGSLKRIGKCDTLPRMTPQLLNEMVIAEAKRLGLSSPSPKLFTLTQICQAFGFSFGDYVNGEDPLYLARNALDDAKRTLRLVEETLCGDVDYHVLQDVVSNAAMRAEVADGILGRFTHPTTKTSAVEVPK